MVDRQIVLQAIYDAVKQINDELPSELRLTASSDTVLFGQNGKLDSLALVSFVVACEQKIQEAFGKPVTLADERAMSQRNSPFRTIGTLAEYTSQLLEEAPNV